MRAALQANTIDHQESHARLAQTCKAGANCGLGFGQLAQKTAAFIRPSATCVWSLSTDTTVVSTASWAPWNSGHPSATISVDGPGRLDGPVDVLHLLV